jgi:hypothetical protein
MSEQQDFATGLRSIEEAQGFSPMQMAVPDPAPDREIERDDLRDAADAITKEREQQPGEKPVDIERSYTQLGGEKAGQVMPPDETVPLDRAARDLAGIRQAEGEALAAAEDLEIQRAVDQLRSGDQQQQPVEQQPEVPPVQQPEATPGGDPDVSRLLAENPKLLEVMKAYQYQADQAAAAAQQQAAQQAEALRQQYQSVIAQNAATAAAALVAEFPELNNVPADQLNTAIQIVSRQNPNRAAAMIQRIAAVRTLVGQHEQAQQHQIQMQQAAAQQQWNQAAKQHDDAFERWSASQDPPQRVAEIKEVAWQLLREDGWSDHQIVQAWHFSPEFRSVTAQKNLYRAAKSVLVARSAKQKIDRTPPVVQRPGSPLDRGSEDDYSMRKLSARLDNATGRDAIKAAAELITARRGRR